MRRPCDANRLNLILFLIFSLNYVSACSGDHSETSDKRSRKSASQSSDSGDVQKANAKATQTPKRFSLETPTKTPDGVVACRIDIQTFTYGFKARIYFDPSPKYEFKLRRYNFNPDHVYPRYLTPNQLKVSTVDKFGTPYYCSAWTPVVGQNEETTMDNGKLVTKLPIQDKEHEEPFISIYDKESNEKKRVAKADVCRIDVDILENGFKAKIVLHPDMPIRFDGANFDQDTLIPYSFGPAYLMAWVIDDGNYNYSCSAMTPRSPTHTLAQPETHEFSFPSASQVEVLDELPEATETPNSSQCFTVRDEYDVEYGGHYFKRSFVTTATKFAGEGWTLGFDAPGHIAKELADKGEDFGVFEKTVSSQPIDSADPSPTHTLLIREMKGAMGDILRNFHFYPETIKSLNTYFYVKHEAFMDKNINGLYPIVPKLRIWALDKVTKKLKYYKEFKREKPKGRVISYVKFKDYPFQVMPRTNGGLVILKRDAYDPKIILMDDDGQETSISIRKYLPSDIAKNFSKTNTSSSIKAIFVPEIAEVAILFYNLKKSTLLGPHHDPKTLFLNRYLLRVNAVNGEKISFTKVIDKQFFHDEYEKESVSSAIAHLPYQNKWHEIIQSRKSTQNFNKRPLDTANSGYKTAQLTFYRGMYVVYGKMLKRSYLKYIKVGHPITPEGFESSPFCQYYRQFPRTHSGDNIDLSLVENEDLVFRKRSNIHVRVNLRQNDHKFLSQHHPSGNFDLIVYDQKGHKVIKFPHSSEQNKIYIRHTNLAPKRLDVVRKAMGLKHWGRLSMGSFIEGSKFNAVSRGRTDNEMFVNFYNTIMGSHNKNYGLKLREFNRLSYSDPKVTEYGVFLPEVQTLVGPEFYEKIDDDTYKWKRKVEWQAYYTDKNGRDVVIHKEPVPLISRDLRCRSDLSAIGFSRSWLMNQRDILLLCTEYFYHRPANISKNVKIQARMVIDDKFIVSNFKTNRFSDSHVALLGVSSNSYADLFRRWFSRDLNSNISDSYTEIDINNTSFRLGMERFKLPTVSETFNQERPYDFYDFDQNVNSREYSDSDYYPYNLEDAIGGETESEDNGQGEEVETETHDETISVFELGRSLVLKSLPVRPHEARFDQKGNINLRWDKIKDATMYDLQANLIMDPLANGLNRIRKSSYKEHVGHPKLTEKGTYRYRIRYRGEWSSYRNISATHHNEILHLKWPKVDTALAYELQINEADNAGNTIKINIMRQGSDEAEIFVPAGTLEPGKTYRFRVRAISQWGKYMKFDVD